MSGEPVKKTLVSLENNNSTIAFFIELSLWNMKSQGSCAAGFVE